MEGRCVGQGRHSSLIWLHFHVLESRAEHNSLLVLPFLRKRWLTLRSCAADWLVIKQVSFHQQMTSLQSLLKLQAVDGAIWIPLLHQLERKVFGKRIYHVTHQFRVAGTFLNF